jgi:hypothetical protein
MQNSDLCSGCTVTLVTEERNIKLKDSEELSESLEMF